MAKSLEDLRRERPVDRDAVARHKERMLAEVAAAREEDAGIDPEPGE